MFQDQLQQLARENEMPIPQIEPGALAVFQGYSFEGNVRELCNLAERVFVCCENNCVSCKDVRKALHMEDVPARHAAAKKQAGAGGADTGEKERIRRALEQCAYNRTHTAKLLGCDRSTLWRKMQKYPDLCKK